MLSFQLELGTNEQTQSKKGAEKAAATCAKHGGSGVWFFWDGSSAMS